MTTPNRARLIAQSIGISEYALNLSTLAPRQIAYNGKYTYIRRGVHHPPHGGWCHLLLLRGASQWLAVITQVPDCGISVVNEIEHIASSVLSFFNIPLLLDVSTIQDEDEKNEWEDIKLTPENTLFIQYLPAGCFSMEGAHQRHEYSVMKFSWEERQTEGRQYFQAGKPTDAQWIMGMWQDVKREDINDLIHNL